MRAQAQEAAGQAPVFEEYAAMVGLRRPRAHGLPELRHAAAILMAHCCYNNVAMLTRNRGRAPIWGEIVDDMLSGIGGPCTVANIFLREFLLHLGFDCAFLPCYKVKDGRKALAHIGLLVRTGQGAHFLDFGNGYPYFSPASFDAPDIHSHGGLHYRLWHRGGTTYAMQHRLAEGSDFGRADGFGDDFLIERKPVPLQHFAAMMHRHYTDPSFSHFLRSLRLIKFPGGGIYALRVNLQDGEPLGETIYSKGGRFRREPVALKKFPELARQHFPQHHAGTVQALDHLIALGGKHHD